MQVLGGLGRVLGKWAGGWLGGAAGWGRRRAGGPSLYAQVGFPSKSQKPSKP